MEKVGYNLTNKEFLLLIACICIFYSLNFYLGRLIVISKGAPFGAISLFMRLR